MALNKNFVLHAGKAGYNDRPDMMREKAEKMMKGDMEQTSKPFSPKSMSSPENLSLIRGYKKGGTVVKKGHRIPTEMHFPVQPKAHVPKRTPMTRVKAHGGTMQGEYGPSEGHMGHHHSEQGMEGPTYKRGGKHIPHKGFGGFMKGVKSFAKPIAKTAWKAAKPMVQDVANQGLKFAKNAAKAGVTGLATATMGPAAGAMAGQLASRGVGKLGKFAGKQAGLKLGKQGPGQGQGMQHAPQQEQMKRGGKVHDLEHHFRGEHSMKHHKKAAGGNIYEKQMAGERKHANANYEADMKGEAPTRRAFAMGGAGKVRKGESTMSGKPKAPKATYRGRHV